MTRGATSTAEISEIRLLRKPRNRDWSFDLFTVAAVVGFANMLLRPIPFGHGFEMVALAASLAGHGTFADPFGALATGSSAANPPLYPLLLALLMKALPAAQVGLVASIGNIVANGITAALLPRVSALLLRDQGPGVVASLFWIAVAPLTPAWDASLTVLCLLLFCMVSAPGAAKSRPVLAGVLAGVLLLLNPSCLLITLTWLGWSLVFRRSSLQRALTNATVTLGIAALLLSPWLVRNYLVFGRFVVRTEFGATLYASNNDCAAASLVDEEANACFLTHHPNVSLGDAQLLRDMGEVRFDSLRLNQARSWIRLHPERFFQLTAARVRNFWFPPAEGHAVKIAAIWIATVMSIPGLLLMAYRGERVAWFIFATLVIFPGMYYVVVSDIRYRYPVLWLTLLPAGYLANALWDRLRSMSKADGNRMANGVPRAI